MVGKTWTVKKKDNPMFFFLAALEEKMPYTFPLTKKHPKKHRSPYFNHQTRARVIPFPSDYLVAPQEASKALLMQLLAPQLRLMALKALQEMPCWDPEVLSKMVGLGYRVGWTETFGSGMIL